MSIQTEWLNYASNVLMPFGDEISDVSLGLLRHAFFCGASTTYGAFSYAGRAGSTIDAVAACRQELEAFMQERSSMSTRLQ